MITDSWLNSICIFCPKTNQSKAKQTRKLLRCQSEAWKKIRNDELWTTWIHFTYFIAAHFKKIEILFIIFEEVMEDRILDFCCRVIALQ